MHRLTTKQWHFLFENVVNQADDGILIVDAREKHLPILFSNNGFYKITGYKSNEIIGENPRFLQGAETDKNTIKKIRDLIKNNRSGNVFILNYKKDGSTFWNNFSIFPIKDNSDNVVYWVGVERDITPIVSIVQSGTKTDLLAATLNTTNDITNNLLNSLLYFRDHMENSFYLKKKYSMSLIMYTIIF